MKNKKIEITKEKIQNNLNIQKIIHDNQKLHQDNMKFKKFFYKAPIAFVSINTEGIINNYNKKFKRLLSLSELNDISMNKFLVKDEYEEFIDFINDSSLMEEEFYLLKNNNESFYVKISKLNVSKEEIYLVINNIDPIKEKERTISKLAYYDTLTSLPNRIRFKKIVNDLIEQMDFVNENSALIYLDIDNFKYINNKYGHDIGNHVLKKISDSLKELKNENILIARITGDEFGIFLNNYKSYFEIERLINKIFSYFEKPFEIFSKKIMVTISLSISIAPNHGKNFEQLIANADLAMHKSKENNENSYYIYKHGLENVIYRNFDLAESLKESIENDCLYIEYQPIVSNEDGEVKFCEALLRWDSDKFGSVSPNQFIPVAKSINFLNEMGYWILKEACKQCKLWHEDGYDDLIVTVNFSYSQIKAKNFENKVIEILKTSGLDPKYLGIEITESDYIPEDNLIIDKLAELNYYGVKILLDDFGTGYSSLYYLNSMPSNYIKLDKIFIDNVTANPVAQNLINEINNLSNNLGKKLIAEGVETEAQMKILNNFDIDYIQGYYYTKPLSSNELIEYIKKNDK